MQMNLLSGFHIVRRRLVGMATKPGMFGVMTSKTLLQMAARRNYPRLPAWLLASQVRTVAEARVPNVSGAGKPAVALTLPKSGFAEDVQSSIVADGRFKVLRLHRKACLTSTPLSLEIEAHMDRGSCTVRQHRLPSHY